MAGYEHLSGKREREDLPTVLVIAPHVTLLKLLEMMLKLEFTCEVLAFVSARVALETAKTVRADLVIIHAHLLDLDALELADRLRHMKGFESIPMLLTHAPIDFWHQSQSSHLIVLPMPFALEDFYAAAHISLDRP
jgi:response regulator RpfG family c-di-GMP phosphodiesterase